MQITGGTPAETGTHAKRPYFLQSLAEFKNHYETNPQKLFESIKGTWYAGEDHISYLEGILKEWGTERTANQQLPNEPEPSRELAKVRQEIENLRAQLLEAQDEGRCLRMDLEQSEYRMPELEALSEQVAELEKDVLAMTADLDMERVQRIEDVLRQVGELEKARDELEEQFDLLEVRKEDLDLERIQRNIEVLELRGDLDEMRNRLEEKIELLEFRAENVDMEREQRTAVNLQLRGDLNRTCNRLEDKVELLEVRAKDQEEEFTNRKSELVDIRNELVMDVKNLVSQAISDELKKQQSAPEMQQPSPEARPQQSKSSNRRKKSPQNQSQGLELEDVVSKKAKYQVHNFSQFPNQPDNGKPKVGAPGLTACKPTSDPYEDLIIALGNSMAHEEQRKSTDKVTYASLDAALHDLKVVSDAHYTEIPTANPKPRQEILDENCRNQITRIIKDARKNLTKSNPKTWRMPLTLIRDMRQGEKFSDYLKVFMEVAANEMPEIQWIDSLYKRLTPQLRNQVDNPDRNWYRWGGIVAFAQHCSDVERMVMPPLIIDSSSKRDPIIRKAT
ncbi:hypothetical protein BDV06DRAFT_219106 [Aspergillus oleicola]